LGVSEGLVHHRDLAVQILGVVQDAQRVDPQILNSQSSTDGNCIAESPGKISQLDALLSLLQVVC
jgi:hypothetical protein